MASHGLPATSRRIRTTTRSMRDLFPMQALTKGLWLGLVTSFVVAAWVLLDRGGLEYYSTPLSLRWRLEQHRTLRPAAPIAHLLGTIGWLMMFMPVVYAARKRVRWMEGVGSMSTWIEAHIFCGIVGPVLVTLHTSLKFNGLVSVAYWAMVAVALSGFVGRYLFVRIPRSIRGVELTHDEVAARIAARQQQLLGAGLPASARDALLNHQPGTSWRRVRAALEAAGIDHAEAREYIDLAREHAGLSRRLERLEGTKRLFGLWHVFHLPLVWLMFAIVTLHVGLSLYLGYWPLH